MNSAHRKEILGTAFPIVAALIFLWFPFDWLSEVWPAFGVPFRILFHDQSSHLIGHTIFFFLIGLFVLFRLPSLQRKPLLYACGVMLAAVVQETIQAMFRQQIPRFDDFNAFKGDVFGAMAAFALSSLLQKGPNQHGP